MKNIEKEVRRLKKEFKIKGIPNLNDLKIIIKKLSFTLLPYQNNEFKYYDLIGKEVISCKPAITIIKGQKYYIFYDNNISAKDLPYILAHEIGHIYLNHFKRHEGHLDTTEHKEQEANEFATLLMYEKQQNYTTPILLITCVFLISLLFFLNHTPDVISEPKSSIPVSQSSQDSQKYVYITPTGKKYHNLGCYHLNDSAISVDIETAKKSYAPCAVCIR